ncbi:glutathione peroxidase [Bacillus sp. 1P06AnD]|uniref:glutathione peroxidase n=1 Tax=Bacillus sp. 1P06AnD TaxID=3132208 RepID=UPI0039A3CA59
MNVYQFEALRPNGDLQAMSEFKGNVALIVNTASKCAFTPQFEELQKLYDTYKEQGFTILGFPCNQFGEQEPGSSLEAQQFCQKNYGVRFPIFSKIDVNGKKTHPLFHYLKNQAPFIGFPSEQGADKLLKMMLNEKYPEYLAGDEIKWNFTKFLIDRRGNVKKRFESNTDPSTMQEAISALLDEPI